MLDVFAGAERKSDVRDYLQQFCTADLSMREIDLARSPAHDVTKDGLWASLLQEIRAGLYNVVIMTPPCNTWSRARFSNRRGPRPVRNREWPWGFPWLERRLRDQCEQGNAFVRMTLEGCQAATEAGAWWLIEHPEDLGRTSTGDVPASIFQLPELRSLAANCQATSFALHQCHYGAATSKPTRLVTTLPAALGEPHQGWPQFDDRDGYRGPLPASCGHRHARQLIGRSSDGAFATAASAAYPPKLCEHIAELIVRSASGGNGAQTTGSAADNPTGLGGGPHRPHVAALADEPTSDEDFDGEPRVKHRPGGTGPPLQVTVAGKTKAFTDGAGLCSPGRWHPDHRREPEGLAAQLRDVLFSTIEKAIPDQRRLVFELATGKVSGSPWPEGVVDELLYQWARLLTGTVSLYRRDYQPFYLPLIGQTLQALGDPDWKVYEKDPQGFSAGVPVGMGEKMPRTPAVFERKTRWRAYDEVHEVNYTMENYQSARGLGAVLEQQFAEEAELGMMFALPLAEARATWPGDRLRIAAQGAIEKGDASWRIVHDGTHGVAINHEIRPRDQVAVPSIGELRAILELAATEKPGVHFTLQADVKKAHRRVVHREADWGLLACRADSQSDQVWVNRCGCFGIGSAAYWWARLAAGVARLAMALMGREFAWQLVYVDDLLWTAWGPRKYTILLAFLLLWEAVGTPFSWKKTRGGLEQDWVGYWFDAGRFQVGISARRAEWLLKWIQQILQDNLVLMRRFAEGLGRLGFAAGVLEWARPFLGPLYSWSSVAQPGAALPPPASVRLVLRWLAGQLGSGRRTVDCRSSPVDLGELFRTDAKGEAGRLVIGGWKSLGGTPACAAEWFSLAISEAEAPWLFRDGDASRTIAAGELLATLVALRLFSPTGGHHRASFRLTGVTDNQGNSFVVRKLLSTKRPLGPLLMELTTELYRRQTWLDLTWASRTENVEADALTNEDFRGFDPALRRELRWEQVSLPIATELMSAEPEFAAALEELRGAKRAEAAGGPPNLRPRQRKRAHAAGDAW